MTGRMSSQRFLSIRGRPDPRAGALPELHGAVLNPAGSRQDLLVLELMPADLVTAVVKQHEPGTGGSLVERTHEIGHHFSLGSIIGRATPCYRDQPGWLQIHARNCGGQTASVRVVASRIQPRWC